MLYDSDELVTNENGAKQSAIAVRFDLVPAKALAEVAHVLDHGAKKYGVENWRGIETEDNLNHALRHAYAFLASREPYQDGYGKPAGEIEELSHAACRIMFALEQAIERKQKLELESSVKANEPAKPEAVASLLFLLKDIEALQPPDSILCATQDVRLSLEKDSSSLCPFLIVLDNVFDVQLNYFSSDNTMYDRILNLKLRLNELGLELGCSLA